MRYIIFRLSKRIKDRAAFTLSEALVTVIILLLVTSIVAAGIPSAIRAYDNVVVASNAEVLLSTTMSTLRNELSTASDIAYTGSSSTMSAITYYNETFNSVSKISVDKNASGAERSIMYTLYDNDALKERYGNKIKGAIPEINNSTTASDGTQRLMSEEVSDKNLNLFVTYDGVVYENGLVTFSNLRVMRDGETVKDTPAHREHFTVKVITKD